MHASQSRSRSCSFSLPPPLAVLWLWWVWLWSSTGDDGWLLAWRPGRLLPHQMTKTYAPGQLDTGLDSLASPSPTATTHFRRNMMDRPSPSAWLMTSFQTCLYAPNQPLAVRISIL